VYNLAASGGGRGGLGGLPARARLGKGTEPDRDLFLTVTRIETLWGSRTVQVPRRRKVPGRGGIKTARFIRSHVRTRASSFASPSWSRPCHARRASHGAVASFVSFFPSLAEWISAQEAKQSPLIQLLLAEAKRAAFILSRGAGQ
jgi:hypothetical protein